MAESKPLTYLAAQCVLSHIEASKRCHIAFSCPSLRALHSLVPLKIQLFKLSEFGFYINDTEHIFKEYQRISNPVVMYEGRKLVESYVSYTIKCGAEEKKTLFDFPVGIEPEDARIYYLKSFIKGKHSPRVDHFEVHPYCRKIFVPEGLKFKIKQLKLDMALKKMLPHIDLSSFPLKKLSIETPRPDDQYFTTVAIKSVKILELRGSENPEDPDWAQKFIKLTNETVHLSEWNVPIENLALLAQNWILNPRKIGTKFTCTSYNLDEHQNLLAAKITELTEIQGVSDADLVTYFPMGEDKKLKIYGDVEAEVIAMEVVEA